ncbi:sensor histidine kinase [Pseudonocardia sichuanensis]
MRVGPAVTWLTAVSGLGLTAAAVAYAVADPVRESAAVETVGSTTGACALLLAGTVIALRRPGNRVGVLLLVAGWLLGFFNLTIYVRNHGYTLDPDSAVTAWAGQWADAGWPTLFASLIAIAFVFPDGVLPSHRWRPVVLGIGLVFVALIVLTMLDPVPFDAPFDAISKPLPIVDVPVALRVAEYAALTSLFVAAAAVAVRYRRSNGLARAQLRWLVFASVLIPATFVICLLDFAFTGVAGPPTFVALAVTQVAIAAAVTVAVLRYRLYEIDTLINRTAVYAVLTGLLAAVWLAIALLGGVAVGAGSNWTTAAATLAVALAFRPMRARVQRIVDRRFDRERFEGVRHAERFLADVRTGRAEPERVGRVLAEAVGDGTVELYFWLPGSGMFADADGGEHPELPVDGRARTPVRSGAQELGVVLHPPALAQRPALLRGVLETLGLAIEIARLRVEVRRQLAQVRDSRARIVAATYAERRRIERNLHDGAQQRLVSVGLTLRHVQHRLPAGGGADELLDGAVEQVASAIEELRELARGLRPAVLDRGLAAALAELASRAPLPVRVDVTLDRLPDDVEAAAYFLASEAVTNVVKHAGASTVALCAGRENGCLRISVTDDGVGGAAVRAGAGLAGLSDRVDALGGHLRIDSTPGRGTRVVAELPCG